MSKNEYVQVFWGANLYDSHTPRPNIHCSFYVFPDNNHKSTDEKGVIGDETENCITIL